VNSWNNFACYSVVKPDAGIRDGPPWLPAKSARVSNLPACCALGPPVCAAPCSCHSVLLQMAQVWQRLADERADSTGLQPIQAERPVMQQQTQPDDDKKE
jgi:hypothetical protein